MEPDLYERIFEKLVGADVSEEVRGLVDAACLGDAELGKLLEGGGHGGGQQVSRTASRPVVPGVTLRSIEVRGFRGIGPKVKLTVESGPGLTLVIGRNGSGKSSFAEALEMLMTGDCARWSSRPKEWERGWRNIHATEKSLLRGSFAVEGGAEVTAKRVWTDDESVRANELEVVRDKQKVGDFSALGWDTGLAAYRPFLSYSELATLVEEPSRLYDQLESILGLEDVAEARKRLAKARKAREAEKKVSNAELKQELRPRLADLDDRRAAACSEALSGNKWDLETVERILAGDADVESVADVAALQRLSQIEAPRSKVLAEGVAELRQAMSAEADLARGSVEQADALAGLLEKALAFHDHDDGPCPVCEQPLPSEWSVRARTRIEQSNRAAEEIREARARTRKAVEALRSRIQRVPAELRRATELGLDTEALEIWTQWEAPPREPAALVAHVEELALALEEAVEKLRAKAVARRQALSDVWQPMARSLSAWMERGRRVVRDRELLTQLKLAEKWLGDVEEELRNDRFEPIAEQAQAIWETLRQESSVSLQSIDLVKHGNQRRVKLNVTVDEAESVALAVMSQGELNALALSLFLPRMTLPDTPFRFLVVDDPVQAMDPLKVDGLARVLAEVARTRQVIVFTHDTRLPEAVRRLRIPARMIEVVRRPDSTVETRRADDPVERHLEDARALVKSEQELGPELTARIVPLFCRSAIEAACTATIRRRRIGAGEPHEAVAELLASAKSTNTLVALALFDSADRAGDVYTTLNNKLDRTATNTYREILGGAHGTWSGPYMDLVREAKRIARCLEAQA